MRFSVALLALLVMLPALAAPKPRARPNVVIFLADDLGYGDLGVYGHPVIETPNLDAFARQGMRLTHAYAASSVCSPSRAAIITGRTPHRNGVYTWIAEGSELHLRTSEIVLPELLKQAGYTTCHVGKWHLNGKFNSTEQPQADDQGYDHWMATQNNAVPDHENPTNFVRNRKPVGPTKGFSAVLVAEEAIRWLDEGRDPGKPFFLTIWTHEPHMRIESDPRFMEPYASLPDVDLRQHHGNVTQLDHSFGLMMQALDERGLADSTFVFFTSDNGPAGDGTKGRTRGSTGGLRQRKGSMYEGGIRVPAIARWPGRIAAGATSDVPVIGSDLFPTVLAMAGVPLPKRRRFDGVDVGGLLTGARRQVARPVPLYWRLRMAHEFQVAMRDGDYKIIATDALDRFELYDVARDSKEERNLAQKDPKRLAGLRVKLQKLHAEIEAEGPDWWKRLSASGGRPPKP